MTWTNHYFTNSGSIDRTVQAAEYSSGDIPGQYYFNGKNIGKNIDEQGCIDFSASEIRVCQQPKKIYSRTFILVRVFRPANRCPKYDARACFLFSKTIVLKITKVICLLSSTVQAVLTTFLQLQYLHQQQHIPPLNQGSSYYEEITLNNQSKRKIKQDKENQTWLYKHIHQSQARELFLMEFKLKGNGQKERKKCI